MVFTQKKGFQLMYRILEIDGKNEKFSSVAIMSAKFSDLEIFSQSENGLSKKVD